MKEACSIDLELIFIWLYFILKKKREFLEGNKRAILCLNLKKLNHFIN